MTTRKAAALGWACALALVAALGLVCLGPEPAQALTVDQVIKLKKAGVSEAVIQKMIETESKVAAQGGVGTYTKRLESGREVIVYQAATPYGVVDYPLPEWQSPGRGGVDPRSVVLGVERRDQVSQALGGSRGGTVVSPDYTLHVMSLKDPARAQRAAEQLRAKGLDARVQAVDLGDKGRWNRVLVGDYASKSAAEAGGKALTGAGSLQSFRVIPAR